MAGEDELACAASSVTRLMQTAKTAMTNGNTPKHSSSSNPGSYQRDAAYYGRKEGGGKPQQKRKPSFLLDVTVMKGMQGD